MSKATNCKCYFVVTPKSHFRRPSRVAYSTQSQGQKHDCRIASDLWFGSPTSLKPACNSKSTKECAKHCERGRFRNGSRVHKECATQVLRQTVSPSIWNRKVIPHVYVTLQKADPRSQLVGGRRRGRGRALVDICRDVIGRIWVQDNRGCQLLIDKTGSVRGSGAVRHNCGSACDQCSATRDIILVNRDRPVVSQGITGQISTLPSRIYKEQQEVSCGDVHKLFCGSG